MNSNNNEEKIKTNKLLFETWMQEADERWGNDCSEQTMQQLFDYLHKNSNEIFLENDSNAVRLIIIELVSIRERNSEIGFSQYCNIIMYLLAYVEYLEEGQNEFNKEGIDFSDKLDGSLTVAYYLSRMSKKGLEKLHYQTYSDAFKGIAAKLQQKPSTIRNMRDEFDPYFDNGRSGWYQKPLKGSRKRIFEYFQDKNDIEVGNIVNDILDTGFVGDDFKNKATSTNKENELKHLIVSKNEMKEIKIKSNK